MPKPIPPEKKIHFDWPQYLRPAFADLLHKGIIAIVKPLKTGGFVYLAQQDVIHKILPKFSPLIKAWWKIDYQQAADGSYNVDGIPYIYYLKPSSTQTTIYLKHQLLPGEQTEIVDKILLKHFKDNYKWDQTKENAICIHAGLVVEPLTLEEYFDQEDLDQLAQYHREYPQAVYKRQDNGAQEFMWHSPKIQAIWDQTMNVFVNQPDIQNMSKWVLDEYQSERLNNRTDPRVVEQQMQRLFNEALGGNMD